MVILMCISEYDDPNVSTPQTNLSSFSLKRHKQNLPKTLKNETKNFNVESKGSKRGRSEMNAKAREAGSNEASGTPRLQMGVRSLVHAYCDRVEAVANL
jgi:hypothetical protein